MKLTLTYFLREQCAKVPPAPHEDLSGKTVVVIGANTGIGFEASKHFASMKPGKLILGCRDEKKGAEALQKIKQETNCKEVEVSIIDLESFMSVNAFADRFEKSGQRLDILILNAAIVRVNLETKADGWESCFQVNNMSTHLLCLLLLPTMSRTSEEHNTSTRIVVVTSALHLMSQPTPKVLEAPNPVTMLGKAQNITKKDIDNRYFDTKMLNVLLVRALSERLKNRSIIVNAIDPGLCATSLRKDFSGFRRFVIEQIVVRLFGRTSEEGSRQLLWAALGEVEDPETLRGAYTASMQVCEPSDFVLSKVGGALQDRFWDDMLKELIPLSPKLENIASTYLTS